MGAKQRLDAGAQFGVFDAGLAQIRVRASAEVNSSAALKISRHGLVGCASLQVIVSYIIQTRSWEEKGQHMLLSEMKNRRTLFKHRCQRSCRPLPIIGAGSEVWWPFFASRLAVAS